MTDEATTQTSGPGKATVSNLLDANSVGAPRERLGPHLEETKFIEACERYRDINSTQ